MEVESSGAAGAGAPGAFPANLAEQRRELRCGVEGPRDTNTHRAAGAFASLGVDDSFDLDRFRRGCGISIGEFSADRVVFDLWGVDVAVANAVRRILIAEVPTVAIETVHMWQNTGVIQDEVLAHRLGLVPFVVDPDMLEYRKENEDLTDENALKFRLHVKCTPADIAAGQRSMPIFASHLKWLPMSKKQEARFAAAPPRPVVPEIVLTRLGVGQEIECDLFLEKGSGKIHAKWSPVATAVYRLLPKFAFPEGPLAGADADDLVNLCPMRVFDIEDGAAVAARPRDCTTCRACLERFGNRVKLTKVKDHFIFTVESSGAVPATGLFVQAVSLLREKAVRIRQNLQSLLANGFGDDDDEDAPAQL